MTFNHAVFRYSASVLIAVAKTTLTLVLLGCDATPMKQVASPVDASLSTNDNELQTYIRELYDRAVREPESATHRGRLGMVYDANGFKDAAIETYHQTYLLDTNDLRWPYLKSLALGRQGRLQEAIQAMNVAIELDSTYVASHLAMGFWLMDLGEFEAACEVFDDADLNNVDAKNRTAIESGRAQCSLELGDLDTAIRSLDSIVDDELPRYVELLQAKVARAQGIAILADQEVFAETAIDQPSWSDPIAGSVVEYTRGLSGETMLAQKLIDGGRAIDALPLISSLLNRYPAETYLVELHSSALIALGRIDEAIEVLTSGLEEFPRNHLIHFNLGLLREMQEQFEDALRHYKKTIELRNEFIPAYDAQTELLLRIGETDIARDVLEESLEYRQPDWNIHYRLGVIHGGHGDWEKSVASFARVIELSPQNSAAYANMALSLAELRRIREAKDAIGRASAISPGNPKVKRAVQTLIATGVLSAE